MMKRRILGLMLSILLIVCAVAPLNAFAEQERGANGTTQSARYDLQAVLDMLCEKWGICFARGGKAESKANTQNAQDAPKNDPAEKTEEIEDSVSAYEKEVVRLVNIERAKYGLSALTYSKELSDGARAKSEDMRRNHYFSHTSPTYGSPFDQMKARGISYRSAGENIAMGYKTPSAVVNAWMNSEGHRANILSAKYTKIGVGYVADGNYCTQWFVG